MVEHQILNLIISILQKEKHPLSNRRLWEQVKAECQDLGIELQVGQQKLNPLKLQKFLSKFAKETSVITEPRNGVFFIKPTLTQENQQEQIDQYILAFLQSELGNQSNLPQAQSASPPALAQELKAEIEAIAQELDESLDGLEENEHANDENPQEEIDQLSFQDIEVAIEEFGSRFQAGQAIDHYEPLKLLSLINIKSKLPVKVDAVSELIQSNPQFAPWLWQELQHTYQKAVKEFGASIQPPSIEIKYADEIPTNPANSIFPPASMSAQINKILKTNHLNQSKKSQQSRQSNTDTTNHLQVNDSTQKSHFHHNTFDKSIEQADANQIVNDQSTYQPHQINQGTQQEDMLDGDQKAGVFSSNDYALNQSHDQQAFTQADQYLDQSRNPNASLQQQQQAAHFVNHIHQLRKKKKAHFKGDIDLSLYEDAQQHAQQHTQHKAIDVIDPAKIEQQLTRLKAYTEAEYEALIISYLKKLSYDDIQKIYQQKGGRTAIYAISPRQQATLILAQLKSNSIDQKTISLLLDNLQHFNAQHGMIITTGDIIKDSSVSLGEKGKITLLDGHRFIQSLIKNEILVKE